MSVSSEDELNYLFSLTILCRISTKTEKVFEQSHKTFEHKTCFVYHKVDILKYRKLIG